MEPITEDWLKALGGVRSTDCDAAFDWKDADNLYPSFRLMQIPPDTTWNAYAEVAGVYALIRMDMACMQEVRDLLVGLDLLSSPELERLCAKPDPLKQAADAADEAFQAHLLQAVTRTLTDLKVYAHDLQVTIDSGIMAESGEYLRDRLASAQKQIEDIASGKTLPMINQARDWYLAQQQPRTDA
jgi:hypothetical protein